MSGVALRYAKVSRRLWGDHRFLALSAAPPNGRDLWQYLLTCPHAVAIPGVIVARRETIAADLGWSPADLDRVWLELGGRDPMAVADWSAGLVWLPRAVRHDPPSSPNHVRSWLRAWGDLPDATLLRRIAKGVASELERVNGEYAEEFLKGLPEGFASSTPSPSRSIPLPLPIPQPLPKGSAKGSAGADPVQEVFEYWQRVRKHPASKLTKGRAGKVRARLSEGYSVDDIKTAIDGVEHSKHHRGENDDGKVWDALDLICRSGEKLEMFIGYTRKARGNEDPAAVAARRARDAMDAADRQRSAQDGQTARPDTEKAATLALALGGIG